MIWLILFIIVMLTIFNQQAPEYAYDPHLFVKDGKPTMPEHMVIQYLKTSKVGYDMSFWEQYQKRFYPDLYRYVVPLDIVEECIIKGKQGYACDTVFWTQYKKQHYIFK